MTSSAAEHILVVEDEEHLAVGIKYNLEAEGYRVTIKGDGPSALAFIDERPDDVRSRCRGACAGSSGTRCDERLG